MILLNDGTKTNETRLGAIGSIQFAIEKSHVSGKPLLVIGGDTLLYDDFDVEKLTFESTSPMNWLVSGL